jgi:branched-chain amino acid transport system II carrier protein
MKKNVSGRELLFIASLLFGMLFGAGNLIFPVSLGQKAGNTVALATLGFCITGVGLPLLAIIAMARTESASMAELASKGGKNFSIFFSCLLYLCIGPLFAIPRTASVSFQVGLYPFIGEAHHKIGLFIFTLLFFLAALYFSLRPGNILTYVGKILNPLFLFFLGILLLTAFLHPMGSIQSLPATGEYAKNSFVTGLLEGYNTLDVVGALAFGNILIENVKNRGAKDGKEVSRLSIVSGSITTVMMATLYFALAFTGAGSRALFSIQDNGGDALHSISTHYFPRFGGVLLGLIICLSCLKTAVGLITAISMAFTEMFPKGLKYRNLVFVFTFFSFAISNLGLSRIIQYTVPALYFIYPMSIVLILLCLIGEHFQFEKKIFQIALYVTAPFALLDAYKALPKELLAGIPFHGNMMKLLSHIPLFSIGMGWLIPAVLAFLLSFLFWKMRERKRQHIA